MGEFKDEKERAERLLEKQRRRAQKKKHSVARALALVTQLGLQMAVCIAIGAAAGIFLDSRLGTSPVFIIICAVLGSGGAVKLVYDVAKDWDD